MIEETRRRKEKNLLESQSGMPRTQMYDSHRYTPESRSLLIRTARMAHPTPPTAIAEENNIPSMPRQISTRRPIRCSGSHFIFLAASTMPAASEPRQDMADRLLVMRALSPYITSVPHHILHQKRRIQVSDTVDGNPEHNLPIRQMCQD
jgi:hypothetical protein